MVQNYNTPKKPSGCLALAGWAMLIVALLMVAFGILFWIDSDNKWSEGREREGKLMEAWEKEQQARESAISRFDSISGEAFLRGDMASVQAYEDSIINLVLNETEVGSDDDVELSRLDSLLGISLKKGMGDEAMAYCDSIRDYALSVSTPMPEQKYLGFPLGGLVSVFVFIIAALPGLLGIILLIIYYAKRNSYKRYQRMMTPPSPPQNPIG